MKMTMINSGLKGLKQVSNQQNANKIHKIVCERFSVNLLIQYCRCLFFIISNIFRRLKLEIALKIPALNEWKIETDNLTGSQGLSWKFMDVFSVKSYVDFIVLHRLFSISLLFLCQVAHGQTDHDYWGRPEDMTMDRPSYYISPEAPGSDLAAETAAAFAASYLVFRDEGKNKSIFS